MLPSASAAPRSVAAQQAMARKVDFLILYTYILYTILIAHCLHSEACPDCVYWCCLSVPSLAQRGMAQSLCVSVLALNHHLQAQQGHARLACRSTSTVSYDGPIVSFGSVDTLVSYDVHSKNRHLKIVLTHVLTQKHQAMATLDPSQALAIGAYPHIALPRYS